MTGARIVSSGVYIPERRVCNAWLENILDLEPGYIEKTTGIKERRWSDSHETVEYMAARAAVDATKNGGVKRIDAIFTCRDAIITKRAYSSIPHIKSALEQAGISTDGTFGVDTANYCAGYAQACNLASLMVQAGQINNALVVASTNYRDLIIEDPSFHESGKTFDRNNPAISQFSKTSNPGFQPPALNSFLWGCGSGAVLIGGDEDNRIIGSVTQSNRRFPEDNFGFGETKNGESFCVLDGSSIYKYAISEIPDFANRASVELGLDLKTVKVVPHQPQPRMLERLADKMGIPRTNLMTTCDYLGNCTAASLPITYHLSRGSGISPGDKVAFLSFGDSYLTSSLFAFEESGVKRQ